MSRDDAAVLDILRAVSSARSFVEGMDREAFESDAKTCSAVLHQLMVIGEAAKRISREFREGCSSLPWKGMTGMRDRLIHDYDDVDLDEVWRTVTLDLPQLASELEAIARGLGLGGQD